MIKALEEPTHHAWCHKCGEPARIVLFSQAVVRCQIEANGAAGRVLSVRGPAEVLGYECGGGHSWLIKNKKELPR